MNTACTVCTCILICNMLCMRINSVFIRDLNTLPLNPFEVNTLVCMFINTFLALCVFVASGVLRIRFIPEMVGPFLQVSLLPHPGTYVGGVHIV